MLPYHIFWVLGAITLGALWQDSTCQVVRYTPEYLACVKGVATRINCSNGVYTAGDVATGAIPNCALPFWEPTKTNRTTVKLLHPNIVITNTTVIPLAASISKAMQYPVGVDVVDSVLWTREPLREFEAVSPDGLRQAWFLDPVLTADMADEPVGALLDMSKLVLQDSNLNWAGYGTFFRRFAAVYDGKVVGLPVSAAIMLFYYRRDFFESRDIPVPATWEEVVEVAERYNGTQLEGGSGQGAWGFCMSRQPGCYNGYTFQSLQVPFLQAQGSSQGFHFDPDTMQPLVNSSGTRRAAELYRRLSRFTAPTENVACLPVSLSFVSGNCLMAVGTTLHFKYAQFNNSLNNVTRVRGRTGTALLPGSLEVQDRATGLMVRCNQTICPYGRQHTLQNGSTVWINSAPYAGRGAFTYALNARSPPEQQYMAYRLCARRAYSAAMWPSVLSATAETTPVRSEMVDPANLGRYTAAGYHPEDTLLFMRAVSDTVEHHNIALNLRIRGAIDYYLAVDRAAVALTNASVDAPLEELLAEAQRTVLDLYANTSAAWLRERYWKSIERKLPPPPPPAPQTQAPSRFLDRSAKIGVGVGVGVGGCLLLCGLAGLVALVAVRYRGRGSRRGAYVPYASEQCTLVVTDVESSTNLWEALPGDVMQAALQLHDVLARRLLARHGGYESATEGDSFIIAFPSALAALRFAAELQAEMLEAKWPAALLANSDTCRPQYAVARSAKGKETQLAGRAPSATRAAGATTATATTRSSALLSRVSPSGSSHTSLASGIPAAFLEASGNSTAVTRSRSHARLQLRAGMPGRAPAEAAAADGAADGCSSPSRSGPQPQQPQQQQQQQQQQQEALATFLGRAGSRELPLAPRSASQVEISRISDGDAHAGLTMPLPQPRRAPLGAGLAPSSRHSPISRLSLLSGRTRSGATLTRDAAAAAPATAPQPPSAVDRKRQSFSVLRSRTSDLLTVAAAAGASRPSADLELGSTDGGGAAAATSASGAASQPLPKQAALGPLDEDHVLTRRDLSQPQQELQGVSGGLLQGLLRHADSEPAGPPTPAPESPAAAWPAPRSAGNLPPQVPPQQQQAPSSQAGPVVALGGGGGMGGLGGGVGSGATWTFGWETCAGWQLTDAPAPGAVMVFRGLRVRVGLHSGVRDHEMARNKTSGRVTFCGLVMRLAKAVSDAAHGGMVVMSEASGAQLAGQHEAAAALAADSLELWHLGRVQLVEDLRPVELFQLMSASLAPRLVLQAPLRVTSQLLPGILSAPTGLVALVRFHVAGLAGLRAVLPELAEEVVRVWEALLLETLPAMGGYLSEARGGGAEGLVAAFADCGCAVAWALCVQADMMHWDWSAELLSQDAFGTIEVETPASFTGLMAGPPPPTAAAAAASPPAPGSSDDIRAAMFPSVTAAAAAATSAFGGRLSHKQLRVNSATSRKPLTEVEVSAPSLLAPLAVRGAGTAAAAAAAGAGVRSTHAARWMKLRALMRRIRNRAAAGGEEEQEQEGGGAAGGGVPAGAPRWQPGPPSPAAPSVKAASSGALSPLSHSVSVHLASSTPATASAATASAPGAAAGAAAAAAAPAELSPRFLAASAASPLPFWKRAASRSSLRASADGSSAAATASPAATATAATAAGAGAGAGEARESDGGWGSTAPYGGEMVKHLLFRGPRTRAAVDVGPVSTEVCRATGRLLYRGRAAKQVGKLLEAAQRGQVVCSPAAHAAAAAAAAACGITLTPVRAAQGSARTRGGGRCPHPRGDSPEDSPAGPGGAKTSHYVCSLAPITLAGVATSVPERMLLSDLDA